MNINLSHPGLDARRKKKFILARLHLVNWIKVSEESEWVWASVESEKEIGSFTQWISKQPICYPVKIILFDSQWHETSDLIVANELELASLFTTTRSLYIVSNNMEWVVEYSHLKIARFGIMNNEYLEI